MLSRILSKLEAMFVGKKVRITFVEATHLNCTGVCAKIERMVANYQHRILYDEFVMKLTQSEYEDHKFDEICAPPSSQSFIPFKSGKDWVEGPYNRTDTGRIQVVS